MPGGNGARCVAAWLVREGTAQGPTFDVDSPAGTHAVDMLADGAQGAREVLAQARPPMTREVYLAFQRGLARSETYSA